MNVINVENLIILERIIIQHGYQMWMLTVDVGCYLDVAKKNRLTMGNKIFRFNAFILIVSWIIVKVFKFGPNLIEA